MRARAPGGPPPPLALAWPQHARVRLGRTTRTRTHRRTSRDAFSGALATMTRRADRCEVRFVVIVAGDEMIDLARLAAADIAGPRVASEDPTAAALPVGGQPCPTAAALPASRHRTPPSYGPRGFRPEGRAYHAQQRTACLGGVAGPGPPALLGAPGCRRPPGCDGPPPLFARPPGVGDPGAVRGPRGVHRSAGISGPQRRSPLAGGEHVVGRDELP